MKGTEQNRILEVGRQILWLGFKTDGLYGLSSWPQRSVMEQLCCMVDRARGRSEEAVLGVWCVLQLVNQNIPRLVAWLIVLLAGRRLLSVFCFFTRVV